MIKQRSVLVLNADYTILNIVNLHKAIGLYVKDKINILRCLGNERIHPRLPIEGVPAVVSLKHYIYVPFKHVNLTRRKVFQRDHLTCQYCNKKLNYDNATIDHVIPRSNKNYPGNTWTNMVTCCKHCNNIKANKTLENTHMKLIKKPFVPNIEHFFEIKDEWKDFIKTNE